MMTGIVDSRVYKTCAAGYAKTSAPGKWHELFKLTQCNTRLKHVPRSL